MATTSFLSGLPRFAGVALGVMACFSFSACSSSDEKKKEEPASGAGGAEASVPPTAPECRNPKPMLGFDGQETGFVLCEIGTMHRAAVHTCPTRLPRTTLCGFAPVDGGPTLGSCRADSECATKPNGYCTTSARSAFCYCDYGCTADADCGAGQVCVCGDPLGKCVPADCASDADCSGGLLCLRTNDANCGQRFACQQPTDECTSHTDCKAPLSACTFENGSRACKAPGNCPL